MMLVRRCSTVRASIPASPALAGILCLLVVPPAGAAPPASARQRPPVLRLRSLQASPSVIALNGGDAEQSLIVTGVPATGLAQDLTGAASYRSGKPKVASVSADGRVRAVGDGSGWIEVRAAGTSVRVPVTVRGAREQRPVSFVRDVVPMLARTGCYNAACHAKAGGKNGFQLSVLAFDPETDYNAIARQARSRRIDRFRPAASLLLKKATVAVPHAGGQRFKPDSPEYRLVTRWIAEGARFILDGEPVLARVEVAPAERVMAPRRAQQLLVTAVYSDGSRRDVTRQAQYRSDEAAIAEVSESGRVSTTAFAGEAAVMARFMGQVAVARISVPLNRPLPPKAYADLPRFNFVDDLVYRKLAKLSVLPSPLCDDATFLRRASLDLTGTLPTAEETRQFLAEARDEGGGMRDESKRDPLHPSSLIPHPSRTSLIDRLLARSEYADYWSMQWSNLLLVNPDLLAPRGAFAFYRWLREAFQENMPFDRFAREIVTASGETYREGPPNFYRALPNPGDRARAVSQLFLGVRLDCAQCHHHPFERWGQDDFYSLAAFFARVKDKSSYPEGYLSVIYPGSEGEVEHPRTGKVMPPRPVGGAVPEIAAGQDRREALARWMTAPENPFFARTIVNRVWAQLMGRGIVEPVDDFRVTNPASNPELLDALAKEFVAHGYDLKHLIRTIVSSAAYQRSSVSTPGNVRDTRSYSRYYKKRLPAEVLLDAIGQVTGVPEPFRAHPEGTRAIQMWDSRLEVEFLQVFGRPGRQTVCECERRTEGSVPQLLHLMNSNRMQERLGNDQGFAAALDRSGKPEEEIVTEAYLTALSRLPTKPELAAAHTAFTREKTTRRQAIEDLLWALLNSAEFLLNH
jgi:hypothetical protein